MWRLWQILRRILAGRGTGAPASPGAPVRRGRQMDDYLGLLNGHPGTRLTTTRLLGGRATDDGVIFTRERIQTEDDAGNAREVEVFDARMCGFGHIIDQDVRASGVCQICGELLCTTPGCASRCYLCGAACCAQHRVSPDLGNGATVTYCSRCRGRHWWRIFWGLQL